MDTSKRDTYRTLLNKAHSISNGYGKLFSERGIDFYSNLQDRYDKLYKNLIKRYLRETGDHTFIVIYLKDFKHIPATTRYCQCEDFYDSDNGTCTYCHRPFNPTEKINKEL